MGVADVKDLLTTNNGKEIDDGTRLEKLRSDMVECQLRQRGINDPKVLNAFLKVPRHKFVRPQDLWQAYEDYPLSIGYGQTISQPYMAAIMVALLDLKGDERVLEIGTGSGYQAAILCELAKEVFTIERIPELSNRAQKTLHELGYSQVTAVIGDGSNGLLDYAPYDAIVVTAAAPKPPQPLLDQLNDGGRLVIPIGSRTMQELMRFVKQTDEFQVQNFGPCVFVPLIGEAGWQNDRKYEKSEESEEG